MDTQNIKKYFPFIFLSVIISIFGASQVVQLVKNLLANAGYIRDVSSIPMSGRCPGEGNGNPLQFSCLENPMDRGAWWPLQSTGLQRVGYAWAHTHRHYLIPRYSSDIHLKMCCICTWLKIRYQLKNHSSPCHADTYTSQNSLVGIDFLHVSGNSQRNTT